jgi:hypothetical protein
MANTEDENGGKIFWRIPQSLKDAFAQACADRKINQQDAGEALLRLAVSQTDETVQAQLFGQIPAPEGKITCKAPKKWRIGVQGEHGSKKPGRRPARGANPEEAQR